MAKSNIVTLSGEINVSYMNLTAPAVETSWGYSELPKSTFEFEFIVSGVVNTVRIPATPDFRVKGGDNFLSETFSKVEISRSGIIFTK